MKTDAKIQKPKILDPKIQIQNCRANSYMVNIHSLWFFRVSLTKNCKDGKGYTAVAVIS